VVEREMNHPQISQITQILKSRISHEKAQKAQKRKHQSCVQHAHMPDGSSCVPFCAFCAFLWFVLESVKSA
jgi:hypothetical protein